jgi:hypothetical protein
LTSSSDQKIPSLLLQVLKVLQVLQVLQVRR